MTKLDTYSCDWCGGVFQLDEEHDPHKLKRTLGYGTGDREGQSWDADLCANCNEALDKLVKERRVA